MALTVRQWRKAREMTQEQMAEKLGVHMNTYMNWEKDPGKISIANAKAISEILEVPLDDIVFQTETA
jgi:transcriptional regulator with XRE-family HTH domain